MDGGIEALDWPAIEGPHGRYRRWPASLCDPWALFRAIMIPVLCQIFPDLPTKNSLFSHVGNFP
jgi:hypothetical protein